MGVDSLKTSAEFFRPKETLRPKATTLTGQPSADLNSLRAMASEKAERIHAGDELETIDTVLKDIENTFEQLQVAFYSPRGALDVISGSTVSKVLVQQKLTTIESSVKQAYRAYPIDKNKIQLLQNAIANIRKDLSETKSDTVYLINKKEARAEKAQAKSRIYRKCPTKSNKSIFTSRS